jgi:hypothetical protein
MLSGSLDCPVSMLSGSLDCPVSMLSGSLDCPVSMLSGSLDCPFLMAALVFSNVYVFVRIKFYSENKYGRQ